jgi:predicted MFS family arabinose efflux permease
MTTIQTTSLGSQTHSYQRYRFVIGGLILFAHFSVGINFFVVAPLFPLIIDDFGVSRATVSLLIALALLIHSFFGLPGGILAVRFGLKRMYFLGWLLMGISVLSALAPNFGSLLVLRLAFGIGFGAIIPASGPLLMQWFRPREVTIMNGLDIAALSLGVALSVSVAAPLANTIGWQNTLSVFGGIALFGAVLWGILGKVTADARNTGKGISLKEVGSVLRNRTIQILVVADALVFMQYTALTSWLPTFYNEIRGMSLTEAGFITGLLPFVGVFAVLVGGFLPLRFESKKPFFIVPGLLLALGGLGSFLIDSTFGIYVSIILLGIGSWSYAPTLLSLPIELPDMTPEKVAVVWGTFVTASGLGMFVSPIVVGAIRDGTGTFVPGFIIWAVGAWALFIAGFILPKVGSKSSQ